MKFNDRDLLVVLLIFAVAAVIETVDFFAALSPEGTDKAVDGIIVASALWFFYKIGKNGS